MFNIKKFDETNSTNSLMKENINSVNSKDVYIAAKQSGGRGRLGHTFDSPVGGLYMSVFFDAVYAPDEMPFVTVIAGICVRRALKDVCGLNTKIKWPNDIYINGRKICGILTELVTLPKKTGVVIGIGLNVLSSDLLPDVATSVLIETGKEYEINLIRDKILYYLDLLYGKCDKHKIADELRDNILKQSDEMDKWLSFYNL